MLTPESALELLLDGIQPLHDTLLLSLPDAVGHVLSMDVLAPIHVPPFNRSPLDGYALHAADLATASSDFPAHLRVIGEADAGCPEHFHVNRGEALRIMTGAPVPEDCDCVVRQEDTDEGMETVEIRTCVRSGMNICLKGEDVQKGSLVIPRGTRLTSSHLGVLASLGFTEVSVYRRPRVLLVCTGDELAVPGNELRFGQVYDANQVTLMTRLMEIGAEPVVPPHVPDDPDTVADVIRKNISSVDLVITTGGVSVGKKDIMHQVLPCLGAQRLFWRISMKPGSPVLCGRYQEKLLICLSGNPYAAVAGFELFAKPVTSMLSGDKAPVNRRIQATLDGSFRKASPQRRMIRGCYWNGTVRPTGDNQTNGSLSAMMGCNCLIDLPAGSPPVASGQLVDVLIL